MPAHPVLDGLSAVACDYTFTSERWPLSQILSKAPLFKGGEEKLQEIKTLIQKLNPTARVLVPREDKYGDLDVGKELMLTGLFDMEEACTSAGWLRELALPEHTPETEECLLQYIVIQTLD